MRRRTWVREHRYHRGIQVRTHVWDILHFQANMLYYRRTVYTNLMLQLQTLAFDSSGM
jgi:hypothetical protein